MLEAYTDIVAAFLAVQTQMGNNGFEVIGAKFTNSKITAIIGADQAEKLKDAHARAVTQVHIREDSW